MARAAGISYGYNRVSADIFQDFKFELRHSGRVWTADSISEFEAQSKFDDLPKHWFFNNSTTLKLVGSMDFEPLQRSCKIADNSQFEIVLGIYCSETKLRLASSVAPHVDTGEFELELLIDAYSSSNKLAIELSVVLGSAHVPDYSPGQPVLPRSRLFDSAITLALTGDYSYLNIVDVDFSQLGLPLGALWTIDFRNFSVDNIEEWPLLDASNVLSVCINTKAGQDFANNPLIQIALWSDISFMAINKVMNFPIDDRKSALNAILNPPMKTSDFLWWLKSQINQGFPDCGEVVELVINTWVTDQASVKANLQSVKANILKGRLSQELLSMDHD